MRTLTKILLLGLPVALGLVSAGDPPQWSVEVRVTRDTALVENATITAQGPTRVGPVTTDAEGRCVLKGAVPGRYVISIEKDGLSATRPKTVSLSAGAQLGPMSFEMHKPAVLTGRVVDAAGNPIGGAWVAAFVKSYRAGRLVILFKGQAETNDLGEYRIAEFGGGRYYLNVTPRPLKPEKRTLIDASRRVVVRKPPALLRLGFYPNSESIDGAAPILLQTGTELTGLDITVGTAESVCLFGAAVPPPEPFATQTFLFMLGHVGNQSPFVAKGSVPPGEEFQVCGLPPGQYILLATALDQRTNKIAGFYRTEVAIGKRDVDLGSLPLSPGLSLHGKVTVEDAIRENALPARLSVELLRRGRPILYGENLRTELLPSGEFLMGGVLADDYRFVVDGLPTGYYMQTAVQDTRDVKHSPVRADGGPLSISLRSDGGVIRGQTVDKTNAGLPGAMVILVPKAISDEVQVRTQESDQNGEFEFSSSIEPGDYRVAAFTGLFEGEEQDPEFIRAHLSSAMEVSLVPKGSRQVTLTVQIVR